jgi:alkanesulfonate monooxygenase SsuD/methylene tetrahydromethanopterin reductase-like flavin-dependent oxidoreductase (luciferase family)
VTQTVPIRTGVLLWNQYTDWPELRAAAITADALGYDSLWTWDHLYPIVGSHVGPILEGYMVLAGWSQVTTKATLGLMVGANTFRNPGLVVKLVTALDHLSGGRAVLGIGGAWFETEHTAFGIDFGASVGERLDWLDEAVEIIHGMLRSPSATASGPRYRAVSVRNDPPPLQAHLPILIGGSGERKTLRTIARYADAWNAANVTPEEAAHKDSVLRRWCDEFGRDPDEIERTISLGPMAIRDDPADAARLVAGYRARNTDMTRAVLTGSAEQIAAHARAYVALGFRHVIYHLVPPFDDETLVRFETEVRPALQG